MFSWFFLSPRWFIPLTLLPAGQLSRSAQPTARSGLSGKPCWLCRMGGSGYPAFLGWRSVELPISGAEEQGASWFLPSSSLQSHCSSTAQEHSQIWLISLVILLNDICYTFSSVLQGFFSVTVFWHFVAFTKGERPFLMPLAILSCVPCCEEPSPNLKGLVTPVNQPSNMFSEQEGHEILLHWIFKSIAVLNLPWYWFPIG